MFSNMVNVGFKVDQYPHKGQKKEMHLQVIMNGIFFREPLGMLREACHLEQWQILTNRDLLLWYRSQPEANGIKGCLLIKKNDM